MSLLRFLVSSPYLHADIEEAEKKNIFLKKCKYKPQIVTGCAIFLYFASAVLLKNVVKSRESNLADGVVTNDVTLELIMNPIVGDNLLFACS